MTNGPFEAYVGGVGDVGNVLAWAHRSQHDNTLAGEQLS
jgi:hypothetical protein